MPRAPSPLTSEPLPYGHPLSTKDFLDSSTEAQSVSIPPVNSNGYDISKQMGGNGCYPGGANGNPCRAVLNGASGSQNPPGFSARQGVAKPLQNVPNVDKLDTCLARPSAPHNNEEQQPGTQMIASVGTCSVPVAIARAPPHGSTPRVAPLLILPPEDKLPSSAVATSPDFKRRYSAVHTEEVQTENAEASSGASKKHKLELTHKPAVGLQCSCASKDETKKEILATAKQPGDRLPESGLPVMAALHTIPGTVVLRESRNRPVTLSQGEYVAAKMYFHPGKMAWRSELLVNGSKRQRSFSCKLYGFERAKKMCEWSRNFVLRTARLPTGDETKEAIGQLMGYTVQTNDTDEAIPHYAGWLYAYPPSGTGPTRGLGTESDPVPASTQQTPPDSSSRREKFSQHLPKHNAGACNKPQRQQPQSAPKVEVQNTPTSQACTGSSNGGTQTAGCAAPHSLLLGRKRQSNASDTPRVASCRGISSTAEPAGGQVSTEQFQTDGADLFEELGSPPTLKAKLKKPKRPKYTTAGCMQEKVEQLSKLPEASPTKRRDPNKASRKEPLCKPRTSSPSQMEPSVTDKLSVLPSLRTSFKRSNSEDKATKRPGVLKESEQQANCKSASGHCTRSAVPKDRQAYTCTNKPLIPNGKSHVSEACSPGLPQPRSDGFMKSRVAPKWHMLPGRAEPHPLNMQRAWQSQTGKAQDTPTCKGQFLMRNKQQEQQGKCSTTEGRELGAPLRQALRPTFTKIAVCGNVCLNGPPKGSAQQLAFEPSPLAGSIALAGRLPKRFVNTRISPPNSALIFSGDDPEDTECIQSAAHYLLGVHFDREPVQDFKENVARENDVLAACHYPVSQLSSKIAHTDMCRSCAQRRWTESHKIPMR